MTQLVSVLSVAIGLLLFLSRLRSPINAHLNPLRELGFALSWALPIASLYLRFERVEVKLRSGLSWIAILAPVPVLFIFIRHEGMIRIGGFDHSALINIAWLQFTGLWPIPNLPCALPPLFVLGSYLAFALFGIRFASFVYLAAVTSVLAYLWSYLLLVTIGKSKVMAAAIGFAGQVAIFGALGYWWYNPLTSTIVVMAFLSCLAWIKKPHSVMLNISLFASFLLVFFAKPNAWLMFLCYFAAGMSSKVHAKRMLVSVSCSITVLGLLLALPSSPIMEMRSYGSAFGRRVTENAAFAGYDPLYFAVSMILLFVLLLVLAAALLRNFDRRGESSLKLSKPEVLCCLVTAGTAIVFTFTNAETKTIDFAPLLFAALIAAGVGDTASRFTKLNRLVRGVGVGVVAAVSILGGFWGGMRMHVRGIDLLGSEPLTSQRISSGFFRGVLGGPTLRNLITEIDQIVYRNPGAKIFFGPRIEFSYAMENLRPIVGMPPWWDPNVAFPSKNTANISASWLQNRPDIVVVLARNMSPRKGADESDGSELAILPAEIVHDILTGYIKKTESNDLVVFERRGYSRWK